MHASTNCWPRIRTDISRPFLLFHPIPGYFYYPHASLFSFRGLSLLYWLTPHTRTLPHTFVIPSLLSLRVVRPLTSRFSCYTCSVVVCIMDCILRPVVSLWLSRSPTSSVSFTAGFGSDVFIVIDAGTLCIHQSCSSGNKEFSLMVHAAFTFRETVFYFFLLPCMARICVRRMLSTAVGTQRCSE
jgi:hypothetical protein